MFPCKWFQVFVLVSSVAKIAGQEVFSSFDLNQDETELILKTQTKLRRYLITTLTDIREGILQSEQFHPNIDGVIHGILKHFSPETDLRTRDLDPFMSLKYEKESHSFRAETIQSHQGGNWNSSILVPDIQITPEQVQKIHNLGEPFVEFVLKGIQKNILKLNAGLLGDILYNFRFRDFSPELVFILDDINQTISDNPEIYSNFQTNATTIADILSDILKHVSRDKPTSELSINQLLSSISGGRTLVRDVEEPEELFDLISNHDYPSDIIEAKNKLEFAVKTHQIDTTGIKERVKGYSPMEKLLVLITKMSHELNGKLSKEIQAVYPHVKLRYLSNEGKFFRPKTAEDVRLLLKSFLTVEEEMVLDEIEKQFADLDWDRALESFDYSKYTKPRPLVVDMVQGLISSSRKVPLCSVIILRYFLRRNKRVCGDVGSSAVVPDIVQEMIVPLLHPPSTTESVLGTSRSPGTTESTPFVGMVSSSSEQVILNSSLDAGTTLVDSSEVSVTTTTGYNMTMSSSSSSSSPESTPGEVLIVGSVLQSIPTIIPLPSRLVQYSLSTEEPALSTEGETTGESVTSEPIPSEDGEQLKENGDEERT